MPDSSQAGPPGGWAPRATMWRRISTKLVAAVLAAVVLPFVAFALFIDEQIADRLTRHVVRQALLGLAKDLAGQIDLFLEERREDVELLAGSNLVQLAVQNHEEERALVARARAEGGAAPSPLWDAATLARWAREAPSTSTVSIQRPYLAQLTSELDRWVRLEEVYHLLLLVDSHGKLVTVNSRRADGTLFETDELDHLFGRDYSVEPWFASALEGRIRPVDHHGSPLILRPDEDPERAYQVGFAAPVFDRLDRGRVRSVLYALVDWTHIQKIVGTSVVKDAFRGLVDPGEEPSPYAWIWAADADTILAHPRTSLYRLSVSRDIGLPELTRAVLASPSGLGLYPEYSFQGKDKNAAFKRTTAPARGGFGWVVGVGIDNDDIYATAKELRWLLLGGTALVLLMATGWTVVIARRTTSPIRELQRTTRRVAEGDLDARTEIASRDELGELAGDFNAMTQELKAQREKLVKAEKDAAWREMARQIAHDIKNPLTPMKLSLDLLERARRENAPGSEQILERTMDLMRRQVENLQRIAGDFYEFTGGRKSSSEEVDVGPLLDEVLHLHDAWAFEQGVRMQREGEGGVVLADLGKLRRVFVNLVSNALQAMPEGGELFVETSSENGHARVSIRDTGVGIPEEARGHLFEPYFTTKSEGTGLGLAISKRVIEELEGTIELEPAADGAGTLATVRIPLLAPPGGPGPGRG